MRPGPAPSPRSVLRLLAFGLLLAALPALAVPDWTLEDTGGQPVSFATALARGPVVVSFWATWCKPCQKELPHLEALAARYGDRATVLAISTDDSKSVAKVGPLVRSRGWTHLTVLQDPAAKVQQELQVGSIPFTILYDRDGREAYRHEGFVEGDEAGLEQALLAALAAGPAGGAPAAAPVDEASQAAAGGAGGSAPEGSGSGAGELTVSDRYEYSYSGETRREIVENWLDLGWRRGGVQLGLTLDSQAPGEEGDSRNEISHRWCSFTRDGATVRAGHFWGLFGRGLLFNAWEDRNLRIDTRLDGVMATLQTGGLTVTALSGAPAVATVDVRAADAEYRCGGGLVAGLSGLTWANGGATGQEAGKADREWAAALRARQHLAHVDWYVEYAARNRFSLDAFDFDLAADSPRQGWALYGNLNLYAGPFTVSWESSDYEDFELIARADGKTALNRPPALAREFTWTLLNRAPHTLNANDEKGRNLDLAWSGGDVNVQAGGARVRRHDGGPVYDLAYLTVQKERWGDFGVTVAGGFQDSEGLRQTLGAEISWLGAPGRVWTLQAEHQHVRMGGGFGFDRGAYDQQWLKLEYALPRRWILAAFVETNNKYAEQREPGEKAGPFPAAQVTRPLADGATANLWAGQRQAGFLCSGGVCKYEPAFRGIEIFGSVRW